MRPRRRASGATRPASGADEKASGWTFHVKVMRDPERILKGVLKAEVAPRGLILRVAKTEAEVARVPVGTPAESEGKAQFTLDLDGREVRLVVAQRGVYGYRLAEDVVEFLDGERARPVAEEYAVPRALEMAAYSPFLIAMIGMAGGAIGGGIAGGIGGGLLTANLAIVRKESWSVAARIWACLAVTIGGTVVFGGLVIAVVLSLRGPNVAPAEPPGIVPVQPAPPQFPPAPPQFPPPPRFEPAPPPM